MRERAKMSGDKHSSAKTMYICLCLTPALYGSYHWAFVTQGGGMKRNFGHIFLKPHDNFAQIWPQSGNPTHPMGFRLLVTAINHLSTGWTIDNCHATHDGW